MGRQPKLDLRMFVQTSGRSDRYHVPWLSPWHHGDPVSRSGGRILGRRKPESIPAQENSYRKFSNHCILVLFMPQDCVIFNERRTRGLVAMIQPFDRRRVELSNLRNDRAGRSNHL